MKTALRTDNGGVLFGTMLMIAIVGILLMGYLNLVGQRARAVARSQSWNAAVPIAEAGLEEAMAHLNHTKGRDMVTNGWELTPQGLAKRFDLGSARYFVQITNSGVPPAETIGLVVSTGFAVVPGTSGEVSRRFRVMTRFRPELRGIVAQDRVTIADLAQADSYDSRVAPYDLLNPGDNTFIGNNSPFAGRMEIGGSAKIYGDVGCGNPTGLNLTGSAVIGDEAFVNNPLNAGQCESGHSSSDLSVPLSAVINPFTGLGQLPGPGPYNGTNYPYCLRGGNYKVTGTFTLDLSKIMMVAEDSTLWVTDTVVVKDLAKIIIAPGKRLKLYMDKQFYISGNGQINAGGTPDQFSYYGLTMNAQFYMSDFSIVNGTVYAPQAKMDLSGNAQLFGGGSCSELVMKGSSKFHYDEALASSQEQPFLITSWSEL